MHFWNYGLLKTSLDQCLKSSVSEEPSTDKIKNWYKHGWNLNDRTFTIFINHSQDNCVRKSLF